MTTVPSYLDEFFGPPLIATESDDELPKRARLKIVGAEIADNPVTKTTEITFAGGALPDFGEGGARLLFVSDAGEITPTLAGSQGSILYFDEGEPRWTSAVEITGFNVRINTGRSLLLEDAAGVGTRLATIAEDGVLDAVDALTIDVDGYLVVAAGKGIVGPAGQGLLSVGTGSLGIYVGNFKTSTNYPIKFFARGNDETETFRMDTGGNFVCELGDVNLTLGNYVLSADGAELMGPGSRGMIRINIGGGRGVEIGHRSLSNQIPIHFYAGSSTPRGSISTTGDVTFASLAGTGNRAVMADSTGRLFAA